MTFFFWETMGPLQLAVTWYKIRHAGEQAVYWSIQNKATSSRQICIFFVLDVPVRSLLSSMADFVPCDRQLQRFINMESTFRGKTTMSTNYYICIVTQSLQGKLNTFIARIRSFIEICYFRSCNGSDQYLPL